MRQLALAVTWAIVSCGARAADWTRVPAVGTDLHYFDRSKIVIEGDEITYWRKVAFTNPVPVRGGTAKHAIYQERIDCRNHTLRSLAWQLFAEEGSLLETATTMDAEPSAIVPETIGDRFQSAMCELVETRHRREAEMARDRSLLAKKRRDVETLKGEIERLENAVNRMQALDPTLSSTEPPADDSNSMPR